MQHCFFSSSAYQNNDITEFEKILKTNHSNIMDDPFIREHIEGEWEQDSGPVHDEARHGGKTVNCCFVCVFSQSCWGTSELKS